MVIGKKIAHVITELNGMEYVVHVTTTHIEIEKEDIVTHNINLLTIANVIYTNDISNIQGRENCY